MAGIMKELRCVFYPNRWSILSVHTFASVAICHSITDCCCQFNNNEKKNGNQFLCAVSVLLIRDTFFSLSHQIADVQMDSVDYWIDGTRTSISSMCQTHWPSFISFYVENVIFPICDSSSRRIRLCIMCVCVQISTNFFLSPQMSMKAVHCVWLRIDWAMVEPL